MIYLVTKEQRLFNSDNYKIISPEEALTILELLQIVATDTETQGLDPYTKKLLSVQLGNFENQVVIDCLTIDIHLFKDYLESDRLFIFWNGAFDLKFFYHQRIIPKNIYDGFIVEKLLYLNYSIGSHEYSLKAAGYNYLGIELDKSVRGQIIDKGLTEQVVVYAANDVKYEIDIMNKQLEEVKKKGLEKAVEFENHFVPVLAYIEYCGVKLDVEKWKEQMNLNLHRISEAEKELNEFVVNYYLTNKYSSTSISQWYCYRIDDELLDIDPNFKYKPLGENRERKENGHTYYEVKLEISFPFVFQDLQGDLFTGFNTNYQCNINWNSNKQVIPLFQILGIKCKAFDPKTKEMKDSIDSKVLEPQKDKFSILPIYLVYKEAQKLYSTYGQNWLDAINPVSKRIHFDFHQLGTSTGRLSSGGGTYKLNAQNLPKEAETRACFIAEPGNVWISSDYTGQESLLMASIANDETMLNLLKSGSDMHSYVAQLAWPEILGNLSLEEIKSKHKDLRQQAKSIEFAIAYGGNERTISKNNNIPIEDAKKIYDNYMNGFKGVAAFQRFRRQDFKNKGYILINSLTGHKAFFDNWDYIKKGLLLRKDSNYWQEYRQAKEDKDTEFLRKFREFNKIIDDNEKASINYVIQGAGALCFKLSSIKLFNYLKKHNLLFKVKYCIPVHDEINIEVPEELGEQMSKVLLKCMEDGAAPFCTKIKLTADPVIGQHWIH